jgi:hypothetical protein
MISGDTGESKELRKRLTCILSHFWFDQYDGSVPGLVNLFVKKLSQSKRIQKRRDERLEILKIKFQVFQSEMEYHKLPFCGFQS